MSDQLLALDLANNTGWALGDSKSWRSGSWRLDRKCASRDPRRFERLQRRMDFVLSRFPVAGVVLEEPQHLRSRAASEGLYGLFAVAQLVCMGERLEFLRVRPPELKRHATGHGNATKDEMLAAAVTRWPRRTFRSYDEVDASWLLDFGLNRLA